MEGSWLGQFVVQFVKSQDHGITAAMCCTAVQRQAGKQMAALLG